MTSEFRRDKYIEAMGTVRVPEGMRSRILNLDTGTKQPVRHGRRRMSMVLVMCLLVVLVSGTALAVSGSGRSLEDLFMREWSHAGGEEMPAEQLRYIEGLLTPVGVSQTVGDLTVTVESAVYCDSYYWVLVNAEGLDFKKGNFAFGGSELQVLTAGGENIAWNYGSLTGLNRERTLVQMLINGQLKEEEAEALAGQNVTFSLKIQDLVTGAKHLDETAVEGSWDFEFPVLLTAARPPVTMPDFTAEYEPVYEKKQEEVQTAEIRNVRITAGSIRFEMNDSEYTGPWPRVLMKNGGDVGTGTAHLIEMDDGWFDCNLRWSMPVDTSQIAALQFGNTVVEVE